MAYLAYLGQYGEGCDYTIACGKKLVHLDATTEEAAKAELEALIRDEYYGERALEFATIYEVVSKHCFDVDDLYAIMDDEEVVREAEKAQKKAEEELRRAQARLADLKRK